MPLAQKTISKQKLETATFAMGCFWTPQLLYAETSGVIKAEVGYEGGEEKKKNYIYEEVSNHETGHAEVVQLKYDTKKISYEKLLEIFWKNHDPTQENRQGPDIGEQYRSAIFYHTAEQKKAAETSKVALQKKLGTRKIMTKIVPAGIFYRAEEYHQNYLKKRGMKVCY